MVLYYLDMGDKCQTHGGTHGYCGNDMPSFAVNKLR